MSSERYRYCIVPMCINTTITTPEKIFFDVPRNDVQRERWCLAMRRDFKKNPVLSSQSHRNVCQDHFDIEQDTENYFQHKLQGVHLRLRKGTVPHIFACQKNEPPAPLPSDERAAKRQRKKLVEDLLAKYEPSTSDVNMIDLTSNADDKFTTALEEDIIFYSDEACQVNLKAHYRSKHTNTTSVITSDFGCTCSPVMKDKACGTALNLKEEECAQEYILSDTKDTADSDYACENISGSDYELENDDEDKTLMRVCMMKSVQKNSLICLGIQQKEKFLIEFLSLHAKCSILNIMITLKKIRHNEPDELLGMSFGMSVRNVSRIFKETLFLLAGVLQNVIVWPTDHNSIKSCLPVAFRRKYLNVQSIIDCFEIPIEKPSNAFYQSITCSDYYYPANTLKYLVSCTPDGTVSFVSKGYGGRATDAAIVEDCGYLKMLFPCLDVMAYHDFRNIAHLIQQMHCNLIRLPPVIQNGSTSVEEVKSTRQVAAVRNHVKRVIKRLRNFTILSKHTCVDHQLVQLFDQILIVVCGIVNCQNKIIKV